MKARRLGLFAVLLLVAVPIAWAITTTTQVNFNVGAVVAYTLTLPGQAAVSANLTGAPTAAIEFNTTNGTEVFVDPVVVGGVPQVNGTPIFQFDNTGTVDLNLTLQFTAATPGCIDVFGAQVFGNLTDNSTLIDATNVTVSTFFSPAAIPQDWYIQANFTGCNTTDTTVRTLRTDGISSN